MSGKRSASDLMNFFLIKSRALFYFGLQDLSAKYKFIDLCFDASMSLVYGKILLNSLADFKLIEYEYNEKAFTYVVKYTANGKRLYDSLKKLESTLLEMEIW